MQFAVQLVFVISRNVPLQPTVTMTRLMLILALGLLDVFAASLAEETAQTEQLDDGAGSERQARELNEDVDVEADSYEGVMARQKRHRE